MCSHANRLLRKSLSVNVWAVGSGTVPVAVQAEPGQAAPIRRPYRRSVVPTIVSLNAPTRSTRSPTDGSSAVPGTSTYMAA